MYKTIEIDGKTFRIMPNGGKLIIYPRKETEFDYLPYNAGIYLLTDLETSKQYVGSSQNVRKRAANYIIKAKDNDKKKVRGLFKHLKADKIKIELLEDCKYLSKEDRLRLERSYIDEYKTAYPSGLNIRCPISLKYLSDNCKELSYNRRDLKHHQQHQV